MGFKEAQVMGGRVIMTLPKDGAPKGVIGRNIDMALVGEDPSFYLPVG